MFSSKQLVEADRNSTGSHLAIIPAVTLPAYSASKAAMNAFTLCLRDQLALSKVKVIELSPPPVQSKSSFYETREIRISNHS
jgi:short-subunit dehydrogenase involved in D-alanine esterification of teichoic acids